VLFFEHGSALEVRLNRPKQMNALNTPMVRAIMARLAGLPAQRGSSIQIVVLTGSGGKVRCLWAALSHHIFHTSRHVECW
jgi:enoyl-CoA hydratase/carnithine racemase